MTLEILTILLLTIANGIFSMSEMAIVSARKARLQEQAEQGNTGAKVALALANSPNRFLSTVQVGITLIGTLAGAFGGAALAKPLAVYLALIPALKQSSEAIAFGLVVVLISYLSLILGELVPKQLALKKSGKNCCRDRRSDAACRETNGADRQFAESLNGSGAETTARQ